ncbi:MAG: FHA domain-containing protein [Actinomycetota bacterium]
MAHLIVRDGPLRGRRFEVTSGEVTIGRENSEVLVEDDGEVSRNHAVVRPSEGGLEIEDLGSTNGTFVNERRITEPTPLNRGDIVRVGQTRLDVEIPDDPNKTIVSGVVAPPTQEHPAPVPPPAVPPHSAAGERSEDAQSTPVPSAAEPPPEPQVDELQVPFVRRTGEPSQAEADPDARAPTSELPVRKKVGGGGVERAGSNKRALLIIGAVLLAVVAFGLYSLVALGAPSRQEYVASINDICREDMARLNDLNDSRARNTKRATALIGDMTVEIEELERPEGNEREIDRFISTFQRVGSRFETLNVSQRANNNRRAREAARRLDRDVRRFEDASRNLGARQCTFGR